MSLTNADAITVAEAASVSSLSLRTISTEERNRALSAIHAALSDSKDEVLAANAKDLAAAEKAARNGDLSQSVLKRLDLGKKGKWEEMLKGILDVRDLEDPGRLAYPNPTLALRIQHHSFFILLAGKITLRTRLDEGLELVRMTCPIGVLLIIFEARPEVIANIASLAIKSGNAAILKG